MVSPSEAKTSEMLDSPRSVEPPAKRIRVETQTTTKEATVHTSPASLGSVAVLNVYSTMRKLKTTDDKYVQRCIDLVRDKLLELLEEFSDFTLTAHAVRQKLLKAVRDFRSHRGLYRSEVHNAFEDLLMEPYEELLQPCMGDASS